MRRPCCGRPRPAISRLVAEVMILVIVIALALLLISPLGSFIVSSLLVRGTEAGTPKTNLEILSVALPAAGDCYECDTGGYCIEIAIKNEGPNELDLDVDDDGYLDWGAWILVADDYYCGEAYTRVSLGAPPAVEDENGDGILSVGEVVYIRQCDNYCSIRYGWGHTSRITLDRTERRLIKLFGPQGTFASTFYVPPGGG